MNAPHEEAVEFAKQSKRENRVYVGNLSYDVKYRDLIEFMRGGGLVESVVPFLSRFFLKKGWGKMQYCVCAEARRCVASRSEARHEFIDPKGGCQQVYDLGMSGARRRGGPRFTLFSGFLGGVLESCEDCWLIDGGFVSW